MSFLDKVTAFLPIGKKEEKLEYFFALNIGIEVLTAALWVIEDKQLKLLEVASDNYSSQDEIAAKTDQLLDQVLGHRQIEPQKILFGVSDSWLVEENLKEEYLKLLRSLVKELELVPMAYVATSKALVHFLEKQEGVPVTAILVGFENSHLAVTVVRAGKIDGTKVVTKEESVGKIIEKVLLTFTEVETLPSKVLIYGSQISGLKSQLLSFSWMSKLNFLHFPKIETLSDNVEIKSICLAGGSELNEGIVFVDQIIKNETDKDGLDGEKKIVEESDINYKEDEKIDSSDQIDKDVAQTELEKDKLSAVKKEDLGFIVGDIENQPGLDRTDLSSKLSDNLERIEDEVSENRTVKEEFATEEEEEERQIKLVNSAQPPVELDDFENEVVADSHKKALITSKFNLKHLVFNNKIIITSLLGIIAVLVVLAGVFLYLFKAEIKVFVEPKILEKEAQVIADPQQKTVNEEEKIIPGEIVEVEVSGSGKDNATGKKQIGDPAKGTVVIRNKTDSGVALSKGTVFSSGGLKFSLDLSVNIASRSGDDGTWGKATSTVTASSIGADGNLPSGSDFAITGHLTDQLVAKSEGNFAGGTSKDVTVVSSEDSQRLLASVASSLRQQAQQKLQEKYPDKKILQEALSESIVKKSYSKNINDQANEFSLDLRVRYKGTSFNDADLKTIVSKLVTTQVPDGFRLDLSETETQADVSELKKDGKLIFLARFRAKLIPRINTDDIVGQIRFKTPQQATSLLKSMEDVLDSEIKITPSLPAMLQRLPVLTKNIKVEVGLK